MLLTYKNNKALSLLLDPNNQTAIISIIKYYEEWKIANKGPIEDFIKACLSTSIYEVIEATGNSIKAIKKLSTGEIFREGDSFWCTNTYEHSPETIENGGSKIDDLYFDQALTGWTFFENSYYVNYVRGGNTGLYKLNEITTLENAPMTANRKKILLT